MKFCVSFLKNGYPKLVLFSTSSKCWFPWRLAGDPIINNHGYPLTLNAESDSVNPFFVVLRSDYNFRYTGHLS
uniref:Uncharacterized protein n=1 Tax=Arundo donax TaxID=35708 RepID=A0A0A9CMP0_ARUDO